MNSLNNMRAFFYRNLIFTKRNVFILFEIIFWPMVSLLSIGIMGDFLDLGEMTLSFILTGAITQGVIQVTQLDVSYSLLYDVWSKSVKHTFLTPVREHEFLIGSWLVGMIRGTAVFILLTSVARILFGFHLPPLPFVAVYLAGLFCCALVIGTCICSLILVFGMRVEVTTWSFAIMLMLISGIYYPVRYLPEPFRMISCGIPITYFLEYIRAFLGFEPTLSHPLIKGFGLCGAYFFMSLSLIHWTIKKARRTGILLRLSE